MKFRQIDKPSMRCRILHRLIGGHFPIEPKGWTECTICKTEWPPKNYHTSVNNPCRVIDAMGQSLTDAIKAQKQFDAELDADLVARGVDLIKLEFDTIAQVRRLQSDMNRELVCRFSDCPDHFGDNMAWCRQCRINAGLDPLPSLARLKRYSQVAVPPKEEGEGHCE